MQQPNKERLNSIIQKRRESLVTIRQFEQRFYELQNFQFPDLIRSINRELEDGTNDRLKIFKDDPYNKKSERYIFLIQLFSKSDRHDFLEETETNPTLKFVGNEFNGKIKISQKLRNDNKFKDKGEDLLDRYYDDYFVENLILTFLEDTYNE